MIDVRCSNCRLIWREDRSKGDSPISRYLILCPRCGYLGKLIPKEESEKEE